MIDETTINKVANKEYGEITMGLMDEEKKMALQYASNGATFMFIPLSSLSQSVSMGSSETNGIAEVFKIMILKKEPIRLETKMIIKYCQNTLDRKNTWLLDQGDIKVIPKKLEVKDFSKKGEN